MLKYPGRRKKCRLSVVIDTPPRSNCALRIVKILDVIARRALAIDFQRPRLPQMLPSQQIISISIKYNIKMRLIIMRLNLTSYTLTLKSALITTRVSIKISSSYYENKQICKNKQTCKNISRASRAALKKL